MGASLEAALPIFDRAEVAFLPVVSMHEGKEQLCGAIYHIDALKAFNRALVAVAAEEHS